MDCEFYLRSVKLLLVLLSKGSAKMLHVGTGPPYLHELAVTSVISLDVLLAKYGYSISVSSRLHN